MKVEWLSESSKILGNNDGFGSCRNSSKRAKGGYSDGGHLGQASYECR